MCETDSISGSHIPKNREDGERRSDQMKNVPYFIVAMALILSIKAYARGFVQLVHCEGTNGKSFDIYAQRDRDRSNEGKSPWYIALSFKDKEIELQNVVRSDLSEPGKHEPFTLVATSTGQQVLVSSQTGVFSHVQINIKDEAFKELNTGKNIDSTTYRCTTGEE